MANENYAIPWAVPDISRGAQFLLGAMNARREQERADENARTQRMFAERNLAISSAQAKRDEARFKAEQEKLAHQRALERANAITPLMEAARRFNPAVATEMGKPHGIAFAQEAAPVERVSPDLFGAARNSFGDFARQTLAAPAPAESESDPSAGQHMPGPAVAPMGQHSGAPAQLEAAPATDAGPDPVGDEIARLEAAQANPARRLMMSMDGRSIEVPERAAASTGLGPEYDAMFNRFRELPGVSEEDALKLVFQEHKSAQSQKAIGDRVAEQMKERRALQDDRQDFQRGQDEQYRLTFPQRKELAHIGAGGRVAAARASQPLKIDAANRSDMGALRTSFKEWKNTVNLAIDSKSHKRLATAMANLDSGNAMQEREAAESLVSIFKGGGQVTKASQDLLLKHLAGLVGDVQTWLQHAATGNFGEMELNVLKQATRNALKEEQEKLHQYHQSAVDTFGPGSGWEQLGGNVNHLVKGAFRQFGMDVPDIYDSGESVVLGSGKRPTSTPGKAKTELDKIEEWSKSLRGKK